jgi:GNAT superfamily N-acetyltransferase
VDRTQALPVSPSTIRLARPDDVAALTVLTEQRWQDSPPGTFGGTVEDALAGVAEQCAPSGPGPRTYVAEHDGTLTGCATLNADGVDWTPPAWLRSLFVVPTRRGSGDAERLVTTVIQAAAPYPLHLWVAPANAGAIRLYERHRYGPTGQVWESPLYQWLEMARPSSDQIGAGQQ